MYRYLIALSIVLASGCATYDVKSNLSYDQTNVPYGVFDWYRPTNLMGSPIGPGPKGQPAVILIHGGAWLGGDKHEMHVVAEELTKHGYVCFAPNYHLSNDITMPDGKVVKGAPWPEQWNNLQTFLTFLHENAGAFGINADRIASLGISAGGHLAQMLHLRPGQFRTVTACDLDGETDLRPPGSEVMATYGDIMARVGGVAGVTTASWESPATRNAAQRAVCTDMSPVLLVNANSHIFINHGERDTNIFVAQADLLAAKCKAVGADYDYVRLPGKRGECHGDCWKDPESLDHLIKWLDTHLK